MQRVKKNRKRHVFGKRRVQIGPVTYILAMHKDGLSVHELYSRREFRESLANVVDFLVGQKHFPLK